ncbi:hypothetical protein Patl1_32085 [Pistacia atlantica]|uniref:Uncharacterized protein n=1 Tax=Pistacia atlantica TaxID=434234 RepID=A0ACC1ARS5_9ROSI|nr:hypothetical protein Patl1_32085 [Pistacia atlantica]
MMRTRKEMFGEGEAIDEAIWVKVTGPLFEFIMSAMQSSTAHFNAIESAKLKMCCHISAWSLSDDASGVSIASVSLHL